jgi:hypothetical protein
MLTAMQCRSYKVECNGLDTQKWPAQSAMLVVLVSYEYLHNVTAPGLTNATAHRAHATYTRRLAKGDQEM